MATETIPPVPKKGHGCFFYGCITCIIIIALVISGIAFSVWKLKQMATNMTDTQPTAMELPTVSPEQLGEYEEKVRTFCETVTAGTEPARIELTALEINALINNSEDLRSLKGHVKIHIENGTLGGNISLPLGSLGSVFPNMAGRYLNGDGSFILSCQNGIPLLQIQSLSVKGKQVPESFLEILRKENLAADLVNKPGIAKVLQRIKGINVQGEKLIVETSPKPEASEPALELTPTTPTP